jgi:hypothetical protein
MSASPSDIRLCCQSLTARASIVVSPRWEALEKHERTLKRIPFLGVKSVIPKNFDKADRRYCRSVFGNELPKVGTSGCAAAPVKSELAAHKINQLYVITDDRASS